MLSDFKPETSFRRWWLTGGILLTAWLVLIWRPQADGLTHVYFLDVGQGDAIFIRTPGGRQILMDGGPDRQVLSRLGKVMPFYDRTLDLVVLTHTDADHSAGLIEVLKKYRVIAILENGLSCDTSWCQEWERQKENEEAKVVQGQLGQFWDFKDGASLLIFSPFEPEAESAGVGQTNNHSLVALFKFGEQSLLLTGDIEARVERKLLAAGLNLDADFLKIAHHGSRTSSMEEFLTAVSPVRAFISVGSKNRYGHPAGEVTARLKDLAIPFFRTDQDGTIELILKGKNNDYEIKTRRD